MLKCLICKQLIFPNLKYEEGEVEVWTVCNNCDIKTMTPEQIIQFESTVNKYYYKLVGKVYTFEIPKEFVPKEPVPELFDNERYAKVDI